ncbi:MAG: flippase-like domain-containing protein [Bacteroidetes bacterium]|nr:flippase-like domain-containing protein [Bacteroidota bacterium]
MRLNKNIKILLNYFLGPLVFLLLSYSIHQQLIHQHNWHESYQQVKNAIAGPQQWKLILAIVLMIVNWGLESRKWQLAIRHVQHISFWRAFKATLTGTTMASFTPNRMGEYLGRILYVEDGKRFQSISLTIVCSISQLLVTMALGCAGIIYLKFHVSEQSTLYFWLNVLLFAVLIAFAAAILFYFRLSWLVKLLEKIPSGGKFLAAIKVLEEFNATILLHILFLSLVRYLVFIAQYYLMFSVFGVSLTWLQTIGGMAVIFLVMAVIPTFTFLTELGLRWEASIQVMELFSANTVGIFAASFGIWLVNLIIPALAGSLLILNIKLFRNK